MQRYLVKNLKNFEYLVGNSKSIRVQPITPYDQRVCNFLGDLSYELNKNKEVKKLFPVLIFLTPKAIQKPNII